MKFIKRHLSNPIIKPSDICPSKNGYQVIGAFNPGATIFNNEFVLLLRVAERCISRKGYISVPYYSFDTDVSSPEILRFKENDPNVKLKDTRGIAYKNTEYLSTMSHLRVAKSSDGVNFKIDDNPSIYPTLESEAFGVEDARISAIDGKYYINYTGVSKDGFCTMLAVTQDFIAFDKLGIIFPPMNKDVAIFEETINGKYYCLHRPNNDGFGKPSIWISQSEDLIHWGKHECLLRPKENAFERMKIGGGAPPIKTNEGWLSIYHGKGDNQRYTLNTILMDSDDPRKVLGRGEFPCFEPENTYETDGFFGNVVFTNGWVVKDNQVWIYYGASDETTCLAQTSLDRLVKHTMEQNN